MERTLTLREAFIDFLGNLPADLTRAQRNEIMQALRDQKIDRLGDRRIKRLLEEYGRGRYEVREVVIVHEDPQ
jgi:hypothetical protein